jgi:predicted amidohydrolase YtcJ
VVFLLVVGACSSDATESQVASSVASPTSIPTDPVVVSTSPADLVNLSLGATAAASATFEGFVASSAIDGDFGTWWSAGAFPVQRIEIGFGSVADVHEIRLVVSQDPRGSTVHRVLDGAGVELHVFSGTTFDQDELAFRPAAPWSGLSRIIIETTESPSWVGWREIEVRGIVTGGPEEAGADTVFVNGTIETMSEDLAASDALAVTDGEIVALGADARDSIGAATRVIDLDGRAVLPGIVDPHTHVLTDDGIGFEAAQARHIGLGYTTVADASLGPDEVAAMIERAEDGEMLVRLVGYLHRTDNCGVDQGLWYESHPPGTWYGDRFEIAGVKVFNDGGTCGPVASSEPFFDGADIGPPFFTDEALTEMVDTAAAAGYQVVIHAQGDLAVRGAQNALETVLAGSENLLRHRIDHNAIVTPELLPRYAEIGIVTVVFGAWGTCADFPVTPFFRDYGENWRAILDANPGGHIAWQGDDPWVVPLDPLGDLYSYVTRAEVAEDGSVCEPEPWLAEHAITVDEALVMMTREAAYAIGVDDLVGTIEVGKRADLIILDASPRAIDPHQIPDLAVLATWIDGRLEYCVEESGLCV